jgi:aryl-phospho-beta-D-glucosidase BglC (GH1 family)
LFNNAAGTRDAFANYWFHVAHRFSDNKYIVGYDPLNEPIGGGNSLWDLLMKLAIQGKADDDDLAPMYS